MADQAEFKNHNMVREKTKLNEHPEVLVVVATTTLKKLPFLKCIYVTFQCKPSNKGKKEIRKVDQGDKLMYYFCCSGSPIIIAHRQLL